jgi:hypothetical protein
MLSGHERPAGFTFPRRHPQPDDAACAWTGCHDEMQLVFRLIEERDRTRGGVEELPFRFGNALEQLLISDRDEYRPYVRCQAGQLRQQVDRSPSHPFGFR